MTTDVSKTDEVVEANEVTDTLPIEETVATSDARPAEASAVSVTEMVDTTESAESADEAEDGQETSDAAGAAEPTEPEESAEEGDLSQAGRVEHALLSASPAEQRQARKCIMEAAILASPEPLSAERLLQLFDARHKLALSDIRSLAAEIQLDCEKRGVELLEVASGYRFQAKSTYTPWLQKLWERKPPRYSRAVLETLALIVYRQPITRGEIEDIRGVVVGSNIIKTLLEREWIKVVGARDVPGKPSLFGTTKKFLDYFSLKSLSDLPPLEDIINLDAIEEKLNEQLKLAIEGNKGPASDSDEVDAVLGQASSAHTDQASNASKVEEAEKSAEVNKVDEALEQDDEVENTDAASKAELGHEAESNVEADEEKVSFELDAEAESETMQ